MFKFRAEAFYQITRLIAGSRTKALGYRANKVIGVTEDNFPVADLEYIHRHCEELDQKVAAKFTENAIAYFKRNRDATWGDYVKRIEAIRDAIEAELSTALFLRIDARFVDYYTVRPLFGEQVESSFKSGIYDIEEAGKCLALARGTATVFHLMRVMELGLKSLGRALEIPYAPSWESYLSQISDRITAKHKTKTVEWKRDEAFFRDLAGDLQLVKLVWRNPTMHIVRNYSQDEAEEILRAVRSFMQRLSARFSE